MKTTEGTKAHGASMTADGFSEPPKTPLLQNPIRFASAFWWILNGRRCRNWGLLGGSRHSLPDIVPELVEGVDKPPGSSVLSSELASG
ncbi:MAG: hypothetical protein PF795_09640 [Kiritimatiellae bacterium]|nr:hypothetical protein [Kiritimatiellia bacterium]